MKVLTSGFLLWIFFVVGSQGCKKKSDKQYLGEIQYQQFGCNSSAGFAFIIHYEEGNALDSFMTATLPEEFKIPDKKIKFQIRNVGDNDPKIFCTDDIIPLTEYVIYNVKEPSTILYKKLNCSYCTI